MNNNKEFEDWKKYEIVRQSGNYNMLSQMKEAAKEAKLTLGRYNKIVRRYSFIKKDIEKEYGTIRRFMENGNE